MRRISWNLCPEQITQTIGFDSYLDTETLIRNKKSHLKPNPIYSIKNFELDSIILLMEIGAAIVAVTAKIYQPAQVL